MKRSSLRLPLIAGLALPALFVIPSLATGQTVAPPPGEPAMEGAHRWSDPATRATSHAARLRQALQLRPDQDDALNAFIASMGDSVHERPKGTMKLSHEGQPLTTPERLDRMAAWLDRRRNAFTARADATRRFYAQLSPSQQKAFDVMGGWGAGGHGRGFDGGPREHPDEVRPQRGA